MDDSPNRPFTNAGNAGDKDKSTMQRLSHWLRFRGTRFSLPRRDAVTLESYGLGSARAGMRKPPVRSKKHATEAGAVASEDSVELTSVRSLQEGQNGGSGVYVVERDAPLAGKPRAQKARKVMNPLLQHVTLVVYGWKSVEPGTLSWVFPSVGAAVAAARAMKNAVRWAIVAGRRSSEAEDEAEETKDANDALDEARAKGAVLIEQAG
jgi:hypothetical protein